MKPITYWNLQVELNEIFLSNNFNGNILVPLAIAPDTKNTTRGVHKLAAWF